MIRDIGGAIVGVVVNELPARDRYYGYGRCGGYYGPDPDAKADAGAS